MTDSKVCIHTSVAESSTVRESVVERPRNSLTKSPYLHNQPSLIKKQVEADIEDQKFTRENYYRTCSGRMTDRRILIYLTQVFFGVGVGAFSMYKIAIAETCEDTNTFSGLLTFVLGVFLPSPSIKK